LLYPGGVIGAKRKIEIILAALRDDVELQKVGRQQSRPAFQKEILKGCPLSWCSVQR
jgi:hypothetical protein